MPELQRLLDPATMQQALAMLNNTALNTSAAAAMQPVLDGSTNNRKALMQLQNYAQQLRHAAFGQQQAGAHVNGYDVTAPVMDQARPINAATARPLGGANGPPVNAAMWDQLQQRLNRMQLTSQLVARDGNAAAALPLAMQVISGQDSTPAHSKPVPTANAVQQQHTLPSATNSKVNSSQGSSRSSSSRKPSIFAAVQAQSAWALPSSSTGSYTSMQPSELPGHGFRHNTTCPSADASVEYPTAAAAAASNQQLQTANQRKQQRPSAFAAAQLPQQPPALPKTADSSAETASMHAAAPSSGFMSLHPANGLSIDVQSLMASFPQFDNLNDAAGGDPYHTPQPSPLSPTMMSHKSPVLPSRPKLQPSPTVTGGQMRRPRSRGCVSPGHRLLRPHNSSPVPLGSGSSLLNVQQLGSGELLVDITPPTKLATNLSYSTNPSAEYVLDAASSGSFTPPPILLQGSIEEEDIEQIRTQAEGVADLPPQLPAAHLDAEVASCGLTPCGHEGVNRTQRAHDNAVTAIAATGPGSGTMGFEARTAAASCKQSASLTSNGNMQDSNDMQPNLRTQSNAEIHPNWSVSANTQYRQAPYQLQAADQCSSGNKALRDDVVPHLPVTSTSYDANMHPYYSFLKACSHSDSHAATAAAGNLPSPVPDPKSYYESVAPSRWRPAASDDYLDLYRCAPALERMCLLIATERALRWAEEQARSASSYSNT